jgi:hypothetical protein
MALSPTGGETSKRNEKAKALCSVMVGEGCCGFFWYRAGAETLGSHTLGCSSSWLAPLALRESAHKASCSVPWAFAQQGRRHLDTFYGFG